MVGETNSTTGEVETILSSSSSSTSSSWFSSLTASDLKAFLFIFIVTKSLQGLVTIVQDRLGKLIISFFLITDHKTSSSKPHWKRIISVTSSLTLILSYLWFTEKEKILHGLHLSSHPPPSSSSSSSPSSDLFPRSEGGGREGEGEREELVFDLISEHSIKMTTLLLVVICVGLTTWVENEWSWKKRGSVALLCLVPLLFNNLLVNLLCMSLAATAVMFSVIRKCCQRRRQKKLQQKLFPSEQKQKQKKEKEKGNKKQKEEKENKKEKPKEKIAGQQVTVSSSNKYAVIKRNNANAWAAALNGAGDSTGEGT